MISFKKLLLSTSIAKLRNLISNDDMLNFEEDSKGYTLLQAACKLNKIDFIRVILQFDLNINQCNKKGGTAILYAIKSSSYESMLLLLRHGADIPINTHQPLDNKKSPYFHAFRTQNIRIILLLLQNDLCIKDFNSLINKKCKKCKIYNRLPILLELNGFKCKKEIDSDDDADDDADDEASNGLFKIDLKNYINAKNEPWEQTFLHIICERTINCDLLLSKLIYLCHLRILYNLKESKTAEYVIILQKMLAIVKTETRDMYNGFNYHVTFKIIKFLINMGADINAKNKFGETCLHLLCGQYNEMSIPEFRNIVNYFLANGANLNDYDSFGFTPLHYLMLLRAPLKYITVLLCTKENFWYYFYNNNFPNYYLFHDIVNKMKVDSNYKVDANTIKNKTCWDVRASPPNDGVLWRKKWYKKDLTKLINSVIMIATYIGIECKNDTIIESIIDFCLYFHYYKILRTIIKLGIVSEKSITRICDGDFQNKSIEKNKQQILELFLKNGTKIDTVRTTQYTPLQSLCNRPPTIPFNNCYNKRIKILLNYNANTKITDQHLRTPFKNLIIQNNILALEIFFKYQKTFDHEDSFYIDLFQHNFNPKLLQILSIHLIKKYHNRLDELLSNPVYANSDYIMELLKMKTIELPNFRTIKNLYDFTFAKDRNLQELYVEDSNIFSTVEEIVLKQFIVYEKYILEKIQKLRSKLIECNIRKIKDLENEQPQNNELPEQQNKDEINWYDTIDKHIQSLKKIIELNQPNTNYINIRDEIWHNILDKFKGKSVLNWKKIYELLAEHKQHEVEIDEQNNAELDRQNAKLVEQEDNLHDEPVHLNELNNNSKQLAVNEDELRSTPTYFGEKDNWEEVFDEFERRKALESEHPKDTFAEQRYLENLIPDWTDVYNVVDRNRPHVQEEEWHPDLKSHEQEINFIYANMLSLKTNDDEDIQYIKDNDDLEKQKNVLGESKKEVDDKNSNVSEPDMDFNGFVDESKEICLQKKILKNEVERQQNDLKEQKDGILDPVDSLWDEIKEYFRFEQDEDAQSNKQVQTDNSIMLNLDQDLQCVRENYKCEAQKDIVNMEMDQEIIINIENEVLKYFKSLDELQETNEQNNNNNTVESKINLQN